MIWSSKTALPKVLSTSVVRGSQQGESHGGVYLTDLDSGQSTLMLDWNTCDIDFAGRGADRGLRGIAFYGDEIVIAASDEVFVFDRSFNILRSYRNRYLKHCHEIAIYNNQLFLTSTGFDSILVFNMRTERFEWGVHVHVKNERIYARTFDPGKFDGPPLKTKLHVNAVFCNTKAVMLSGLRHDRLMRFREDGLDIVGRIPKGTHNVQMHRKGILYNDTARDRVFFSDGRTERSFDVPVYSRRKIVNTSGVSDRVARAGFARGLCPIDKDLIVTGSSPSTLSVHSLDTGKTVKKINLSMDIRNAIHGLEVWPYDG